jgi:hypothetical protein
MSFSILLKSEMPQDDHRLPEGMKRIGYDSDTERYYFRDRDGVVWQGAEGAEFSEMTRGEISAGFTQHTYSSPIISSLIVSPEDIPLSEEIQEDDIEAAPTRADGYQRLSTDPVGIHLTHSRII